MKKFIIKEHWIVSGTNEYYTNDRDTLAKVKKYIKSWIEGWQDSAEDNEYKFLGFKTDYKTFARCRIKTNGWVDKFYLKVEEVK